jgi:predicted dehydrogenase
MDVVRIAMIGTGPYARDGHMANLLQIPAARIVGLWNRGEENLRAAKAMVPDAATFSSWQQVLEAKNVDAVIITLPPQFNAEIACAALSAGKDVLCEKPLSNTLEGCASILQAQRKSGRALQVGLQLYYSQLYQALKADISAGAVGAPLMAWFSSFSGVDWAFRPGTWVADLERGGGVFNTWAVHAFVLLNDIAASQPASVFAAASNYAHDQTPGIVDGAYVTVKYRSEAMAALSFCRFLSRGNYWLIGAAGQDGKIEVDFFARTLTDYSRGSDHPIGQQVPPKRGAGFDGNLEQLEAFVESVRTGARPAVDASVGYWCTAVALAAQASATTGRAVHLGTTAE